MDLKEKTALWMKRFHGRTDVYARKWYDNGRGNYSPVCSKFWSPGCHIKLKDGISCAKCEIRQYEAITHDSVLKHIQGIEEHSVYLVREDSTVTFGAIDFDCKPNRDPKTSYYFEEVMMASRACDEYGIKHAIARSTSDGFHLYIFFDKPYPAAKAKAVMVELIFERAGFMEKDRLGIKNIPEFFPKQTSVLPDNLGNPIKPPMVESRFPVERNCWVTNENVMIPADQQWEYFSKIPCNTAEHFDQLIKDSGLTVDEIKTVVSSGDKFTRIGGGRYDKTTGEWDPPTVGSMEKLIHGCAAFRRLREKMDTGYQPGHDEGFALFQCGALHTQDGMDYFKAGKVPGWGATDKDWKQLMQSVDKNYAPWTCKTMQSKGVCVPGTKCFDKRPKTETIHGQKVLREDLPEDQWPDPSPIRYATGVGEEFLAQLLIELDALDAVTDEAKRGATIREIAARAQSFDKDQQTILKQAIEKKGFMKKRDLNAMFKQAEKERSDEATRVASSRTDVRNVVGVLYRKLRPFGYEVSRKVKGSSDGFAPICNFDMIIREVKTVMDDDDPMPKAKYYKGVYAYDGIEKPFEMTAADFFDNSELFVQTGSALDMRAGLQKSCVDDFRSAVQAFSDSPAETIYRAAQGWYEDAYIMPKVMVDKLGVRGNEEKPLDVVRGSHAQFLGFKYISDSENKEVLFHMKTELFKAFPRGPLFIGIAHTMLAGIISPLGLREKPTLWYEGLSGRGKSTMAYLLQQFYGNFTVFQNWTGTYKAMLDYCHRFKDTVLVIDDYKSFNDTQKYAAEMTVQYGYDGNSRSALGRDGGQRGDKGSRCLLICSGEDTPFGQASIISRMLIIPYPKLVASETKGAYAKCIEMQEYYCGITPRFIHFFLNQDINKIKREINSVRDELESPVRDKLNAPRICMHFAWNFVAWKLFMGFMLESGAMGKDEHDALVEEHRKYVVEYRDLTIARCAAEQHGRVFLGVLRELIMSGRASITGLNGFENEHAKAIGFVRPSDPDAVYIHPSIAVNEAKRESVHLNTKISLKALGEQMIADGIIMDHDDGTDTKMVVDPNRFNEKDGRKVQGRMWMMRLDRLGIEGEQKKPSAPVSMNLENPIIKDGLI